MSLIEQAAQRLEQLRQAGVDIPGPRAEVVSEPKVEPAPPPVRPEELPHPPATYEEPVGLQSPEMVMSRRVELDLEILAAAGIIRPDAPRSQLADEYRVIKRPLIDNARAKALPRSRMAI